MPLRNYSVSLNYQFNKWSGLVTYSWYCFFLVKKTNHPLDQFKILTQAATQATIEF
jgi:hypothetical protein